VVRTQHKLNIARDREFDITGTCLDVRVVKHALEINEHKRFDTRHVIVTPTNGVFAYEGREYCGSLEIFFHKGMLTCVAYLDDAHQQMQCNRGIQQGLQVHANARTKKVQSVCTPDLTAHRYPYNVRVLLGEQDYYNRKSWHIRCEGVCAAVDPDNDSTPIHKFNAPITIKEVAGKICINGIIYEQQKIYLVPLTGHILFEDRPYLGAFMVTRYNGKLLLVNSLDIEDYVYSVLKSESWPGWPIEVNKAFAIASRSYVIAMVFRARTSKLPYHIKNTNVHQTYNGHHDSPEILEAVNQTKGVFLSYKKQPIIAMFDICCGGVVPAKVHDFDFSKAPYLARPYACTYCKGCRHYAWQAVYGLDDLQRSFTKEFPHVRSLKTIKVAHKDNAGLVRRVTLHGQRNSITATGKKVRSVCKRVKSLCFSIARNGDDFIFKGRGYGHHLGICQWGAREMVRRGYDFEEVLQFYYPKTSFMKLG
jgi:stage II sporulation protein D